jgi:hypothetical protein
MLRLIMSDELIRIIVFVKDRWPGIPPIPGALQKEDGNVNLSEMPQAAKTKLVATEEQAEEAGLLRAQH